jgi:midasin
MKGNKVGQLACEALALIANALTRLEVGQIGILSFGEVIRSLHHLDQPFTEQSGAEVISQFTFDQQSTNVAAFLAHAVSQLEAAREQTTHAIDQLQLIFIVSDGRVLEDNVDNLRYWIREAASKQIFVVFLIIDNPKGDSILDVKVKTKFFCLY